MSTVTIFVYQSNLLCYYRVALWDKLSRCRKVVGEVEIKRHSYWVQDFGAGGYWCSRYGFVGDFGLYGDESGQ